MRYALVFGLILLAGCINKGIDLGTQFNPAEVQYILGPGEGVIEGRAFLAVDGQIVNAAGQEVQLIPVSSYALERMQAIYGNANRSRKNINVIFTNPDPSYEIYKRKTRADFEGKFQFTNVPDGNYFVASRVVWGTGHSDAAAIRKSVRVTGGNSQMVTIDGN